MSKSWLKWQMLRALGNSAPAKLTILAPLVGYLLVFNEYFIDWFGQKSGSEQASWFSKAETAKLYIFYFGLFFIGVGSTIYQIFCPTMIKKFENADEFLTENRENLTPRAIRNLILATETSDEIKSIHSKYESGLISKRSDEITDLVNHYFDSVNNSGTSKIITTFLLYTIGFILIGTVSIISAVRIFIMMCKSIS